MVLHAEVCAPAGPGPAGQLDGLGGAPLAAPPPLAAQVLHLRDGSTQLPVGLFLHSSHAPAAGGALLEPGVRLRASAPAAPPPPGCGALPPLMPTAAAVVELPAGTWSKLEQVQATPLGRSAPLLNLRPALERAAAATVSGGGCSASASCMEGWLVLRVECVGAREYGGAWGVHTVRTVTVRDARDGSSDSTAAGAAAAAAGGALALPLILRDEEQAALGDLLAPGEVVAVLGMALQPLEAPDRPGSGGGGHCALLLGERFMVAAPQEAGGDEKMGAGAAAAAAALQPQPSQQQPLQQQVVLPPLGSLQPGTQGLVVWGSVRDVAAAAGGRLLSCVLVPCDGGSSSLPLRMQLAGGPRGKVRAPGSGHAPLPIHTPQLESCRLGLRCSPKLAPALPLTPTCRFPCPSHPSSCCISFGTATR
jgi:hypothetical protein